MTAHPSAGRERPEGKFAAWLYDFRQQWQLQLMVWPGVVFIIVFGFLPLYGYVMAFQNYTVTSTIWNAPFVGLANFQLIVTDPTFWSSLVNTLGISLLKLVIEFPLSIVLAIMVYELAGGVFKRVVQAISYLPHFISWIVLGGMLVVWLSSTGLFNQIFGGSTNLLQQPGLYWLIAALSDTWKEVGWGTILYLAAMAAIDPSLYEVARVDGAGRFRRIWHITLPGIRGMIALQVILWVSGLFGSNLDQTMVLNNPLNDPRSNVINFYVYQVGLHQGNFSYGTAVGLGISLISLILLLGANFATKKLNDNTSML
ncbi:MAG: ABC transporter permease subunit [Microbacteriaceae bacterium]|nr:ABC transporter permease subunit [Microbacteriaceae bacterium]MCL2793718.1 ABC transporter permease subunit [Microbacteriaceae bacterium]